MMRQKLFSAIGIGGATLNWPIAHAQSTAVAGGDVSSNALLASLDPVLLGAAGAVSLAIAAVVWAMRVSAASKTQSIGWSRKLAEMEARLEKSDSVLSAHPGLVLVWEDDNESIETGWGDPKILGGPAALASLLAFSSAPGAEADFSPVGRLLESLGDLPLEDDTNEEDTRKLRDKVTALRAHGIAFSGSIVTSEGREIEADGRVAGGQVALWLTDPAVRMAEEGTLVGKLRERTTDLHGALSLLERSPFPAWRRNADLTLAWVNKAYVEAVEAASLTEVLRQQIELDSAGKALADKASTEGRQIEGRVIVNIHGERRVLRIAETPMHNASDAALGGVAIDITDLDKARSELIQHTESNRRTLDQIRSGVVLFGANQNLTYYNQAFQDLWGLADIELTRRPSHGEVLDLLRQAGKLSEQADYTAWRTEQLALYTQGMAAPGGERDGQARDDVWRLPDGRSLRVSRQRHPLGGVLIVFDDITEKLHLEARFNTQIGVQRATLNKLDEGVAVFAADGSLRLFNAAFQKLWRLQSAILADQPHIDKIVGILGRLLVDGGQDLISIKHRATSLSPEDRRPIKAGELRLKDGRTFGYGLEPLPDGATLVHFLDITDSHEREKELEERNAILEDADRLKSKFIDHVSYHLRTPLSTVIGFSEMLDGQMFGILNDRQKDYIADILTASYHLRDLITDVIDLAAIDAGKMSLDVKPVDIRKLIENAATYSALKAEDTQVSLTVECAKNIGLAPMDEQRIKQVLFNLLSNAFAYTGPGGEITIGASRSPQAVKLWVVDSGRGVSPNDQAKAFDAFESRGPSSGAGLGLSLVERFVKLHGGWVKMESTEGDGTRVTCHLPIAENSNTADTPTANKKKEVRRKPAKKRTPKNKATMPAPNKRTAIKAAE